VIETVEKSSDIDIEIEVILNIFVSVCGTEAGLLFIRMSSRLRSMSTAMARFFSRKMVCVFIIMFKVFYKNNKKYLVISFKGTMFSLQTPMMWW